MNQRPPPNATAGSVWFGVWPDSRNGTPKLKSSGTVRPETSDSPAGPVAGEIHASTGVAVSPPNAQPPSVGRVGTPIRPIVAEGLPLFAMPRTRCPSALRHEASQRVPLWVTLTPSSRLASLPTGMFEL